MQYVDVARYITEHTRTYAEYRVSQIRAIFSPATKDAKIGLLCYGSTASKPSDLSPIIVAGVYKNDTQSQLKHSAPGDGLWHSTTSPQSLGVAVYCSQTTRTVGMLVVVLDLKTRNSGNFSSARALEVEAQSPSRT